MSELTVSLNINYEHKWCVSCSQPFWVTVALAGSNRSNGRDIFCPQCGCRHNRREDSPMIQLRARDAELERACENAANEEQRLGRVIAGLRGALSRLKAKESRR